MIYFYLKLIHIISSTILFGTGLGSAFYMYRANLTSDLSVMHFATKNVVLADFIFTTPAVIIQPITGFLLIYQLDFSLYRLWILLSLFLYLFVGLCWIPVVFIQMRLLNLLKAALTTNSPLTSDYHRLYSWWLFLGWPAFISVLLIFYLMIFKP